MQTKKMVVLPQKLQVAIYGTSRRTPYYNRILHSIRWIESDKVPTMGVDKDWRLYYNPDMVANEWTDEEMITNLAHEFNHVLRNHHARGNLFPDPQKFNRAGDMEINPDLRDAGMACWKHFLYPAMINMDEGLLAEVYYNDPKMDKPKGVGKEQPSIGSGDCGSVAGGDPRDYELPPEDGDAGGLTQAEKDIIVRQSAKDIDEAARSGVGNIPSGLKRWADDLLHPTIKWTKELAFITRRAIMEVSGQNERTFRRPSRVSTALSGRVLLPGTKNYVPSVAMVFDTSGSMGTDDLSKALGEAKGVFKAMAPGGQGVQYVSVDCQASAVKRATKTSRVDLSGGGGTDMGVGLAVVAALKPMPNICIVLTDGFTPWPPEPPPFKTIIVVTNAGGMEGVPSWARGILVN